MQDKITACVARMAEKRGAYSLLVVIPRERRQLERPRCRWENIKMDMQEVEWGTDWINMVQVRDRCQYLVNAVMNLRLPQNAGNFLTS